jgi:hypothetical protein
MSCQYCGRDDCGSSADDLSTCNDASADLNYARYASSRVETTLASKGVDLTKIELLWRTRLETTLNHFQGLQREMADEEDAAKREIQKAYFAGAARAWELAVTHIEKLVRL